MMLERIFEQLSGAFQVNVIQDPTSIYFSIGETKKTVFLTPQECRVADGKAIDNADCVCKTSTEFFLQVWNQGYRPGLRDFLSGAIKSNNPSILQNFLIACGKR